MTARRDVRASAHQLPVRTSEQLKASLRNPEQESRDRAELRSSEQDANGLTKGERLAAEILDEAFHHAGLRNPEIAELTGVGETMVIKWRSTTSRGTPNFVQLLACGLRFWWELFKAMNRRPQFAFGRLALQGLLERVGMVAAVLE